MGPPQLRNALCVLLRPPLLWQKTTDIPPHHFMKYTSNCEGARDIDATTRGLGATPAVPTTSCGEENLLMQDDRHVLLGGRAAVCDTPEGG